VAGEIRLAVLLAGRSGAIHVARSAKKTRRAGTTKFEVNGIRIFQFSMLFIGINSIEN